MAGLLDFGGEQPGGLLGGLLSDPGARLGLSMLAASSPRLRGLNDVMAQQDHMQAMQRQAQQDAFRNKALDVQTQRGQLELDAVRRQTEDEAKARQVLQNFYGAQGIPAGGGAQATAPQMDVGPAMGGGQMPAQQAPAGGVAPKSDAWLRYKAMGDELARNGLVKQAEAQYSLAEKFRPKYSTTPQIVRDPQTGKLVNVLIGEDGTTTQMNYGVKPDVQLQSLGDRVMSIDKNDLQNGQSFAMGQSPDSRASNAVAWANHGLSKQRFQAEQSQATKPTFNAETGTFVYPPTVDNPQGRVVPAQGFQKPLNDVQSKALLFGSRMQESDKIINDLGNQGRNFSTPGANTGWGVGAAVNLVNSEKGQMLDQAKRDFINATLRRESGAAIAESEFENAAKQYFPQMGDSPKVIEQKARNRALATQGILAEVPKNTPPLSAQSNQGQQSQQAPAPRVPMKGQVVQGHKFLGGDPANPSSWEKQ